MQADAAHAVHLGAPSQIFPPIGQCRIDGADGQQQAAGSAAFPGQAGVRGGEILVQQGVEDAGPGLRNSLVPQPSHKSASVIERKPAKGA
jgi:hypothetical protein